MDEVRLLLQATTFLIAFDQLVKAFVISFLRESQALSFGMVTIRKVINKKIWGAAFQGGTVLTALWAAEVVFFVAVIQFSPFFQGTVAPIGLGMALGGAGSNLFDYLWRDGVVDFIDFRFWPVFNIADVAIVVGALIGFINV
jgi:signal peptidase II